MQTQSVSEAANLQITWLSDLDQNIGQSVSNLANPILVKHLEELLHELAERNQEHITWVHELYGSWRYRLGDMVVSPIENISNRLRTIRKK